MPTERQNQANGQNALVSTGPRTPRGKAVSRLNAMRGGLLSRGTLLVGKNEQELVAFGRRLRARKVGTRIGGWWYLPPLSHASKIFGQFFSSGLRRLSAGGETLRCGQASACR